MTQVVRPPHIERCKHVETRGGIGWQCLLADPHPGQLHRYPIDAEHGRHLDAQPPIWLAATLRDETARRLHAQDRVDELQAVAMDLLKLATGIPVREDTAKWVRTNAPASVTLLDFMYPKGWSE